MTREMRTRGVISLEPVVIVVAILYQVLYVIRWTKHEAAARWIYRSPVSALDAVQF